MKVKPSTIEILKTQIKLHISSEYYDKLDSMLKEAYILNEGNENLICLRSFGGDGTGNMCMMFSTVNGSFYDTCPWEYVKQKGEQITII